jgi:mannose-P-dolichol utilization defect 1
MNYKRHDVQNTTQLLQVYTNCALYGILEGHPLTAFGENIALLLQSLVIVYLVWTLSTKSATPVSLQEKSLVVTCLIGYITVNNMFLPEMYRYLLMSSNLPILLYSRGSQILETYRIQHTGAQSIVTLTMNFVGGLIRILTTIQEVGWDIAVLAGYGLSLLLTSTLFIQYFYYQANTAKFIADLKVQVDKKQQ